MKFVFRRVHRSHSITVCVFTPLLCVADGGGDAEGWRAGLAEGPGLRGKHLPSVWDVRSFPLGLFGLKHCSPQEGALPTRILKASAISDFIMRFYASTHVLMRKSSVLPSNTFIFLHTVHSGGTRLVNMHRTWTYLNSRCFTCSSYFHIWCWIHWFCTVCLFFYKSTLWLM